MRKIISIILIAIMLLCGCTDSKNNTDTVSDYKIILPSDNTVNGYRNPIKTDNKNNSSKSIRYYANLKTKKFHLKDCAYAKKTSEENLYISKDKDELISSGYIACKICNP